MTNEERDFIDSLMISGLTDVSWKKALADIVRLQTAKIFLDSLSTAGLSAESWKRIRDDVDDLLKTKTFVDGLRTVGFSKSTWEQVYAAALAAGMEPTEEYEDDDDTDVIVLEDGTVIPDKFVGKTYKANGTVTVGHFIVTNAKFTVVADDIIIVEGIKFVIVPDIGAGIFNISFTKPETDYKLLFSLNKCSVIYNSSDVAAVNGDVRCNVETDVDVTVKSDYTLTLQNETTVSAISGFSKISSPVLKGYFIYHSFGDEPVGVGYSSESTVDIRVSYDENKKPTFTAGEGTTVTIPWYNEISLEDEKYDHPLKPVDKITVTNKGQIGRLIVETDTPITFAYNNDKSVKTGDIKLPTDYDITLIKVGDVFTVKVNEANVMIPDVGTVKLDITNSIVWFDINTAIYSKNHIVVDVVDSVLTGTLNSFTGLLIGRFNNLTVNSELQNLSGVNQFAAEEGVNLYDFSHDIVLLKSNLLLDILRDYAYNPATMMYFWENVIEHEQATDAVVTTPLGDESVVGITNLGMPLRVFRAYFKALATQSGELVCSLEDKHNVGLAAVSARKNFVDYVKRFQRLVRSVYKNYIADKVDSTPAERVAQVNSALKALCNIDLTNEDCGSIIGLDAGGILSKKLDDMVANPVAEISSVYPTKIFKVIEGTRYVTVKNVKLVFPQPDNLSEQQKKIVCELAGWYYSAIFNTLETIFGQPFGFAAKNFSGIIKTVFEPVTGDDIVTVQWETDESLRKNNGFVKIIFNSNKLADINNLSGKVNNIPVDISLLRAMVLAMWYVNLPYDIRDYGQWFVKGGTEFSSSGIDNTRSISSDWNVSTHFVSLLTEQYDVELNDSYVWGAVFMRWLFKTLAEERGWTLPDSTGQDTQQGGSGGDTQQGGGSDDTQQGGGGSDTTQGGGGTDTTPGGTGTDTQQGGSGTDTQQGSGGDTQQGGSGSDTQQGSGSGDTTQGGQDTQQGGSGTDTQQGGGTDTQQGGGTDTTQGGDTTPGGQDTQQGGGTDTTQGGGTDTTQGSGSDTQQGGGTDTQQGGSGTDTTQGSGSDTQQGSGSDTQQGGQDTTTGGQGQDTQQGSGTDTQQGGGTDIQQGSGSGDTQQGGGTDTQQGGGTDTTQGGGTDTTPGSGTDTTQGGGTTPGGQDTATGSGGGQDTGSGGTGDTQQGGGTGTIPGGEGQDANAVVVSSNGQTVNLDLNNVKTILVDAANVTNFNLTGTFNNDHKIKLFTGTTTNIVSGYSVTTQGNGLKISGAYNIMISGGGFETEEWSPVSNNTATYTYTSKAVNMSYNAIILDISITETATVTGIKSTADITVDNKVITLRESALNQQNIVISGNGYTLALDKDYPVITAATQFYGMDYRTGDSTEGYRLSSDAKTVNYTAAVPGAVLFSLSGVKNTSDITVNNKVVTVTETSFNDRDIVISGEGYTLALDKEYSVKETTEHFEGMVYKSGGNSTGYTLSSDRKTINYTAPVGVTDLFTLSGLSSTAGVTVTGKVVTLNAAVLNKQTVTISDNSYTLALNSDITGSSTVAAGWSLSNSVATYKTAQTIAGYDLVNNQVIYTAASGGDVLVTVTGVRATGGLSLNGTVVTVAAEALDQKSVTVSTGYTFALNSNVTTSSTIPASWTMDNNTATYKSAATTEGYSLVDNQIVYTAASSSSALVTVTGVKSLNGVSLNNTVVVISESALNGSDITVSGNGYTLALDGDYAPKTTDAHFDGSSYKSESATAGYVLSSDAKTISYVAATPAADLFSLSGVKTTDGITVNNKTVILSAANLNQQDITISGSGYILALDQDYSPAVTPAHFEGMDYKTGDSVAGYTLSSDFKTIRYIAAVAGTVLFTLSGIKTTDGITVANTVVTLKSTNLNQQEVTISDNNYTLALASGVTLSTTAASNWTISGVTATYKSGKVTAGYKLVDNKVIYVTAAAAATLTKVTGVKSIDGLSVTGTVVTVSGASLNERDVTIQDGEYTLALGSDAGSDYTLISNKIVYIGSTVANLSSGQSLTGDLSQYTTVIVNGDVAVKEAEISTDQPVLFAVKDANNLKVGSTVVPVNVGVHFSITNGSYKLTASKRCIKFDIANLKDTAVEFTNVIFLSTNNSIIYAPVKTDITVNSTGAVAIPSFKGYLKKGSLTMTVNGSSYTDTALKSFGTGITYTEDPAVFLPTVTSTYDVLKDYYYDCQTGRYSFEPATVSEDDIKTIDFGYGDPGAGKPLNIFRNYFRGLASTTTTPETVREAHKAGLTAVGAAEKNLDYYAKQYYMTVKYLYNKYYGWKKTYTPASSDEATRLNNLSNVEFYKELANINLANKDSGLLTGFDASGLTELYNVTDIVPDPSTTLSTVYPETVCSYDSSLRQITVDGITYVLQNPSDLSDKEKKIICELSYWYFKKLQDVLTTVFGFKMFSYNHPDYHQNLIEVVFGSVASVAAIATASRKNLTINGETKKVIYILINRNYSNWDSITSLADTFSFNRYETGDNSLLHEFVHAYQNLCLPYRAELTGSWFIEGGAELISQGADLVRILPSNDFNIPLFTTFSYNLTSTYSPTSDAEYPYIHGYIFLRWLFKRLSEEHGWKHPITELEDAEKVTSNYAGKHYRVKGTATIGHWVVNSPKGKNGKTYSLDVYFPEENTIRFDSGVSYTIACASTGNYSISIGASTDDVVQFNPNTSTYVRYPNGWGAGSEAFVYLGAVITSMTNCKLMLPGTSSSGFFFVRKGYMCGMSYSGNNGTAYLDDYLNLWCSSGFSLTGINVSNTVAVGTIHTIDNAGSITFNGQGHFYDKQETFERSNAGGV